MAHGLHRKSFSRDGLYAIRGGKSRQLLPIPLSDILPLSRFKIHPNRRQKMAKKPMTKSQIVSYFAGKFELTKKTASGIIEEVAALAVFETKKAGSFTIPGIGKLVLVKRKARMGRNPATGEPLKISAKTVVRMRVATAAKEAIVPPKK